MDMLTSQIYDATHTALKDLPRQDAELRLARILRIGEGPAQPQVAAFQASI